jgi:hypothetical protein
MVLLMGEGGRRGAEESTGLRWNTMKILKSVYFIEAGI